MVQQRMLLLVTISGTNDSSCTTIVVFTFNARTHGPHFSGRRNAEKRWLQLPIEIVVSARNVDYIDEGSLLCLIRRGASMMSLALES
jgi:hypothetical protein